MLNRLTNLLIIFGLFASIIFTQQIMNVTAQDSLESEKTIGSNKLPILLDNDFIVEKFVVG